MTSMLALALFTIYLALAFGVRTLTQLRRTGSSGFKGISGRPGSVEWLGGVLFATSLALHFAAPLLDLTGVVALALRSRRDQMDRCYAHHPGSCGNISSAESDGGIVAHRSQRIGADGVGHRRTVYGGAKPYLYGHDPRLARHGANGPQHRRHCCSSLARGGDRIAGPLRRGAVPGPDPRTDVPELRFTDGSVPAKSQTVETLGTTIMRHEPHLSRWQAAERRDCSWYCRKTN